LAGLPSETAGSQELEEMSSIPVNEDREVEVSVTDQTKKIRWSR